MDQLLNPTQLELLKSLPKVVGLWRNDVDALVRLGFAVMIKRQHSTSLKRTDAGTDYLKSIGQYDKPITFGPLAE